METKARMNPKLETSKQEVEKVDSNIGRIRGLWSNILYLLIIDCASIFIIENHKDFILKINIYLILNKKIIIKHYKEKNSY